MVPEYVGNVLFNSQYKIFLNLLDSNTTNIFKKIFTIQTEDVYKN